MTPLDLNEWVAYLLVLMKGLLAFASTVFLISGLDDLFIDLWYVIRGLYRRFFIPSYNPLTTEQLLSIPEQPLAIMLPAWDESAVIRPMLMNTLRTLNYQNYHIFVGVYPNDPATRREVERVMEQYANVHIAACGNDGPTNKADCLNWICQEIRRLEKKEGIQFVAFIMQDSEDVIHPLCYKLVNYMFPQFDMVQLPVLSLPRKPWQFTGGHYLDEFAQLHQKDLVVRESISHSLPAAGVGCAFSHRALETVARYNNNEIFSVNSLTEDYDFGLRLRKYGLKQIFVKFFTTRTEMRRSFWTRRLKEIQVPELVCIREYFPDRFWASVRQKSRWVLGICLQGWKNLGWEGDLATKYMLYRDRKALLTNLVNMLGYVIVLVVVPIWINSLINPEAYRYPPLVVPGSWVWYVLLVNAVLFVIRIVVRTYFTGRLYGFGQAMLSFPRMIWGNFINFLATMRAIFQYLKYLRTGKTIAWDKTAHVYPEIDDISH
ncbi:glycosyl transferase family protein [Methylobacter sp. sgz302048]|uniref:glycosyl transferase family protein n=1 Tax=Methylobacter sp. sgz302048 TaxID=3455945 RepID=UPI003F9EF5DA